MSNLFFPQLNSGSVAQYPILKTRSFRTVRNLLRDGRLVSFPDYGSAKHNWELVFSALSNSEMTALKALFDASAGRYLPFTFLDPTDNLFGWSCDLTQSVWTRSSLIRAEAGFPDPVGGQAAFRLTNVGQAFEQVSQTISAPSNYFYTVSCYVRSLAADSLTFFRNGSSASDRVVMPVGTEWQRSQTSGCLNDPGLGLTAGFSLAPGQSVYLFGPQLEAQSSCSPYKSTGDRSGAYPDCFWASDSIEVSSDGPDSYSTVIKLEVFE